jgi:hypothetical protein
LSPTSPKKHKWPHIFGGHHKKEKKSKEEKKRLKEEQKKEKKEKKRRKKEKKNKDKTDGTFSSPEPGLSESGEWTGSKHCGKEQWSPSAIITTIVK